MRSSTAVPDTDRTAYGLTTKGKMALAWEDRTKPEITSTRQPDGTPLVKTSYGAEIISRPPIEYDDGIEVAITKLQHRDAPRSLLVGIAWASSNRLSEALGPMSVEQLGELIDALTSARDEADRVGLLKVPKSRAKATRQKAERASVDTESDADFYDDEDDSEVPF